MQEGKIDLIDAMLNYMVLDSPKENISIWTILGRTITLVVLLIFEYQLITSPGTGIVIDHANFLIHETGHLVFSFTGVFIRFLGGSLFQILVPIIAVLYFHRTKQYFASGFSFFWLGDNIIYVSSYINDARSMALPLFGGDTHDWNWLLNQTGLLQQDHTIAGVLLILGYIIGILGIVLCTALTLLAFKFTLPKLHHRLQ